MTTQCSTSYTTGGSYQCTSRATYVVGERGLDVDEWRASCSKHLAKVVAERIASISENGSVVVAKLD